MTAYSSCTSVYGSTNMHNSFFFTYYLMVFKCVTENFLSIKMTDEVTHKALSNNGCLYLPKLQITSSADLLIYCRQCVSDHMVASRQWMMLSCCFQEGCSQLVKVSSVTVEVPFLENKEDIELGVCACLCVHVCVFTYSSCDFSAGWHERMRLLHNAAREVANASLLLSIIRVLHLKITWYRPRCCQHLLWEVNIGIY